MFFYKWLTVFGVEFILEDISNSTECNLIHNNYSNKQRVIKDNLEEDNIENLCEDISNVNCYIKQIAHNTVIYDGNLHSKIMLIGEAPGQEEDIQGKPFVGQSGLLLNNMLKAIGLSRSDVIISNIVFCRPPANRNPSNEEITLCLPFVHRLIKIVKPKVILLLGSVAAHSILNTKIPISRFRGKVNEIMGCKVISTYHPAYILRSSSQKKLVFNDLILFSQLLKDC